MLSRTIDGGASWESARSIMAHQREPVHDREPGRRDGRSDARRHLRVHQGLGYPALQPARLRRDALDRHRAELVARASAVPRQRAISAGLLSIKPLCTRRVGLSRRREAEVPLSSPAYSGSSRPRRGESCLVALAGPPDRSSYSSRSALGPRSIGVLLAGADRSCDFTTRGPEKMTG